VNAAQHLNEPICGITFGEGAISTAFNSADQRLNERDPVATLIGVFSFCNPSRGPTSTICTRSLIT
jgi:hypothetical protein